MRGVPIRRRHRIDADLSRGVRVDAGDDRARGDAARGDAYGP